MSHIVVLADITEPLGPNRFSPDKTNTAPQTKMPDRPRLRHIDTLPDEILSEIQFIATSTHDDDFKRYGFPSVVCKVSRRWRGVAYTTPKIWSFILICSKDTLGHTQDRVSRAGGVLLSIKIHDPKAGLQVTKVLESLLPRSDRWVSLYLDVWSVKDYAAHLPAELPLLKDIFFKESGIQFTLNMALPRLESMRLQKSWLCWDPSATFGCLREFRVVGTDYSARMPVRKLVDFLRNSPNLEVLELNDSWVFGEIQVDGLISAQALGIPAVDLFKLTSMQLRGLLPSEIVTLPSCLRTPGLRNLMISVDPDHFEGHPLGSRTFEEFHFDIPSVRELALGLCTTTAAAEHILLRMQHVHSLSVIGCQAEVHPALVSVMKKQALAGMASRLSNIYIRDTPAGEL